MNKSTLDRPAKRQRIRLCIRLWDWSEWGRQVVRGVQHFAHARPEWALAVDAALPGQGHLFDSDVPWDGVITSVLRDVARWRRFMIQSTPNIVAISSSIPTALKSVPSVRVDDLKVAETIGRHLLAGGLRRLGLFASNVPSVTNYRSLAMQRYAHSQQCPLDVFESARPNHSKSMMRDLIRWVRRLEKPVGIVTWNMDIARQIIEACDRAGIKVPDQAAIVAWDDDLMIAETVDPTISGMVLPAERLGYEAAQLMDRLLKGETPSGQVTLVPPAGVLHVRESSDMLMLPDRDVHLAQQYIREHFTQGLKVDQIARALRISRRKLEQDFQRVLGITPHDAMTHERLERAKQLLVETDWPLQRVALQSGMGTVETLRRVWLKHLQTTPGEYRKRFGTSGEKPENGRPALLSPALPFP